MFSFEDFFEAIRTPNLIFPKDLGRCEDVITNALWLSFNKSSRWFMEKLTLLEISSWPIVFFTVKKNRLQTKTWKICYGFQDVESEKRLEIVYSINRERHI